MTFYDAAYGCDELTLNGYSDWRLPTKEELKQLYLNKDKIGGFVDKFYWSSTDAGFTDEMWGWSFDDGRLGSYSRGLSNDARCVRSF
jgi:hypothetical protein